MTQLPIQHIAENLRIPVWMCAKTSPGLHEIVVHHPQRSEAHAVWIPVVSKAEVKSALKPPSWF
jgi:hypothetical protein